MNAEARQFDRPACISIPGGGAYGLTLLGRLAAVDDAGYVPAAVARDESDGEYS